MPRGRAPLFLARDTYRLRRLGDLARMVPVIGFLALLLPLLWQGPVRSSFGWIYLFGIWAGLIATAAWLSNRLKDTEPDRVDDAPSGPRPMPAPDAGPK